MIHEDFCRALWDVPLEYWSIDEAMNGHPELVVDDWIVTVLGDEEVEVNGVAARVYGLNGLRDKIVGHWMDECLPKIAEMMKRKCLGEVPRG